MAATTFASFYAAFRDLSVTGVRNLNEAPLSVPTAHLPCKWVQVAGMEGAPFIVGQKAGWPALRCQIVILMNPMGQGRHPTRWSDAVTMMDTLNAAIVGMAKPCKSPLSWSIELQPNFADSGYFAVVATVEGEG